jgi:WD40 repeat protein
VDADNSSALWVKHNGQVWRGDPGTGAAKLLAVGHRPFRVAALNPHGPSLATDERENYFIDLNSPHQPLRRCLSGCSIANAGFTADGRTLFAAGPRGELWRVDVDSGEETLLRQAQDGERHTISAWSRDGCWLATAVKHRDIDTIEVRDRRLWRSHLGEHSRVVALAITPDGRTLAVADGAAAEVRFRDSITGQERGALVWSDTPAHGLALSPDGNTLAVSERNGGIKLLPWQQLLDAK